MPKFFRAENGTVYIDMGGDRFSRAVYEATDEHIAAHARDYARFEGKESEDAGNQAQTEAEATTEPQAEAGNVQLGQGKKTKVKRTTKPVVTENA